MFERPLAKAAAASLLRERPCGCPRETSETMGLKWLIPCDHERDHMAREEQERYEDITWRGKVSDARRFYDRHRPPAIYRSLTLEDLDGRDCSSAGVKAARRYIETWEERQADGQGLTFSGDIGTGKSLVASVIANEVCGKLGLVLFATVTDFQTRMKQFDTADEAMRDFKRADLVVLDDFGQERATEWAASHLFDLIDSRTKSRLPTIVTTNLGAAALRDHYVRCLTLGKDRMPTDQAETTVDRILSRIRERNAPVLFEGDDQRATASHDWLEEANQ